VIPRQPDGVRPGSLPCFIYDLGSTGDVQISRGWPLPADAEEVRRTWSAIHYLNELRREECPLSAPQLDLEAAGWAAATMYRMTQFLVYRDLDAAQIVASAQDACPKPMSPLTIYSVDLTFNHLPRLMQLAVGFAPRDPLIVWIHELCSDWPLSSVGGPRVKVRNLEPILSHHSLRLAYRDRVIATQDLSRLTDDRVIQDVKAALGAHPELSPSLAVALYQEGIPSDEVS